MKNKQILLEKKYFFKRLIWLVWVWSPTFLLSVVGGQDLVQLRVLDLSHNEVQMLEAKVFHYMTSLVKLNLRNNRLSQISPDVFLQAGT